MTQFPPRKPIPPEVARLIDQQTFQRLERPWHLPGLPAIPDSGVANPWHGPPRQLPQTDLSPYYRALDKELERMSERLQIPVDVLKGIPTVPVVSTTSSRPRLQDRLWSTARRLYWRLRSR